MILLHYYFYYRNSFVSSNRSYYFWFGWLDCRIRQIRLRFFQSFLLQCISLDYLYLRILFWLYQPWFWACTIHFVVILLSFGRRKRSQLLLYGVEFYLWPLLLWYKIGFKFRVILLESVTSLWKIIFYQEEKIFCILILLPILNIVFLAWSIVFVNCQRTLNVWIYDTIANW